MGGRGASSGTAKGNSGSNSFAPKRTDDVTSKLSGKTLSLGANTVTIKDERGKTVGMVRNISRVSTASPQDQAMMHKFSRDSGVDIRSFGVENIYKSNGKIYIFNNIKADAVKARLKNVNKEEYNRFAENKRKLREAENAGAYVVNYINR